MRHLRYFIFLRDTLWISLTSFGGPQAHISLFFRQFVDKRRYLSEEELIELNALCQVLPGPTSTQTITAIGYRIGGFPLALLTLFVWTTPTVSFMITAALLLNHLQEQNISLSFTRFIQPMAVGFIAHAALRVSKKIIKTKTALFLMIASAAISSWAYQPWVFPLIILAGGVVTAFKFEKQPKEMHRPLHIRWRYFTLYAGLFAGLALVADLTDSLSLRLLTNFYRLGSLIFGGGQVLVPMMYGEFVKFKHLLSGNEFLTGYAIAQAMPGPTFSFASYVGALAMRHYGPTGSIWGGILAATGIFLPGTFLIFFVIQFWDELKKYRPVRASLEGINATSAGLVIAAAILLFFPLVESPNLRLFWNIFFVIGTFLLLQYSRIPAPLIVVMGLILGFIIKSSGV
ncbi:chromate transporter [Thermonema lapsum]|uniref:Chromate transporter n=1 Tax=Thermonema lapsum TaxID=28195 RepID=A0A846MN52_9BACT|nr:chromate efflux transporter [Thermonema lapsum]NIK72797.1 chromate transporter [Thermonema lapsum]